MRIRNRSGRSTKELRALVEYAAARCRRAYMAEFEFGKAGENRVSSGQAWKDRREASGDRGGVEPALVRVELSHGLSYPLVTGRVYGVPTAPVESWQEEALAVILHEARHIDQFMMSPFTDRQEAEVDAETFAQKALQEYQRERDGLVALSA